MARASADFEPWKPRSPLLRARLGVLFATIGVALEFIGGSCLNHTSFFTTSISEATFETVDPNDASSSLSGEWFVQPELAGGCARHKGIIMTCVGSSSLFVGLLFILCRRVHAAMGVFTRFALDAFCFGFVLTIVGAGCMEAAPCKRCPRVDPAGCNWIDGVVMVFAGSFLLSCMSGVPSILSVVMARYPEIARRSGFMVGFWTFTVSCVMFSLGIFCETDNLFSVDQCHDLGKWSPRQGVHG